MDACLHAHTHIRRIVTKMMMEDLTYKKRLKDMHLTTLKERRDLITIYKLKNNLEETIEKTYY